MDFNMLTRFSTAPRIVTWSFEGRREDVNVNGFGDVGCIHIGEIDHLKRMP